MGRVLEVSNKELTKRGVKIIVRGETITLYFEQDFDLKEQEQKISNKVKGLDIIICTSAKTDEEAFELLKSFFRKI